MSATHPLIVFYDRTGVDSAGRTLADVRAFSFEQLEDRHDYIQWLFPLRERSQFNPQAPVVDNSVIATFTSRSSLQRELELSFQMMLRFYGFIERESDNGYEIVIGPDFPVRSSVWLTRGNHNFLRLTRILKSLCLLGKRDRALAFYACLQSLRARHAATIGEHTFACWANAVA